MNDEHLLVSSCRDCEAFMERARRCVSRAEELRVILDEGADGIHRTGGGGSSRDHSAPTEAAALFRVCVAADKLDSARRELEDCERTVGAARLLCAGIRDVFLPKCADVLELHYLERESWNGIAELYNVTRQSVYNWRDIAFNWVDSLGARYVMGKANNGQSM